MKYHHFWYDMCVTWVCDLVSYTVINMAVTWNLFQICVTSMVTIDKFFLPHVCTQIWPLQQQTQFFVTHVTQILYVHNKHNKRSYKYVILCHTCTPLWSQQTQWEKYVTHVTQIHLHGHNKHSFLSHYVKYNLSPLKSSWDIINIAHSWREVNICQIRQEQHMSVPVLYVDLGGNLR